MGEFQQLPEAIWTLGHSTLAIEDFLGYLRGHDIGSLADVRRFPGSRAHPQFNAGNLAVTLPEQGIRYLPLPELGGRRPARKDSHNTAWRNASFRGYADYMETEEFAAGIGKLLAVAVKARTAIMCAESLWWRCHRGLIADYVQVRGVPVSHIVGAVKAEAHPYTTAARIVGGKLSYTADTTLPLL